MEPTVLSPPSTPWKELKVDSNDMDPPNTSLPRITITPSPRNNKRSNIKPGSSSGVNKQLIKSESDFIDSKKKNLDPAKYFGEHARKDFFANYQQMHKHRLIYSGHEATQEQFNKTRGANRLSLSLSSKPSTTENKPSSMLPRSLSTKQITTKTGHVNYDENIISQSTKSTAVWGDTDAFALYDDLQLQKSSKNFYGSNKNHIINTTPTTSENLSKSLNNLKLPSSHEALDEFESDKSNLEEFSPRTKYIGACIRDHITPLPKLVLRKHDTTKMNLSHFGIRDPLGKILAECLDDLPNVESIDVSGNSLTDKSLPFLFKSFQKISNLHYLNLSRSKIDDETSDALAEFLANPECPLISLVLQNSDIDDFECARFIGCLKTNKNLRELDLGSNLLGSAEIFQGAKSGSFKAGGIAIADFIASSDCRLHTLKLSWNNIKMASSIEIAKSIQINHTLIQLDLSFNGLGQLAGEYLGDSLQNNKTLQTLLLDNNQLNGVATFCICVGLQQNQSIKKISLDKNPIGEFGARAVIQVPEAVGHRTNLSAVGCNTKLRESITMFNFSDIVQDYSLHLDKPFERTIALWLLEKIAGHTTYTISKIVYEPPGAGSKGGVGKGEALNLVLSSTDESEAYYYMDEQHKVVVDGLRTLLKATESQLVADELFSRADIDGNEMIDKEELLIVLNEMGYPVEPETIDDIFSVFDVDFSETLEMEEFMMFLESKKEETQSRLTEMLEHYFYALSPTPNELYVPPKSGILHLSVVNNYSEKGPQNVVTVLQQQYVFEQAAKIGDVTLVCDYIQHTRLRYNEALKVFKSINAETGNMANALSKVLVRMHIPTEAKALLSKITGNDFLKVSRVRQALGNAYQPLLGNMNGFFSLNLSVDMDRLCLSQLLEHSKSFNCKRCKDFTLGVSDGKIGDTSQHGNWTSFRNEVYNNELFVITAAAFTPMKKSGILEFDYSSVERPLHKLLPLSDFRLCRILHHLALIEKDQLFSALSVLGELKDITVYAEKNFAHVIYEPSLEKAKKIGLAQEEFYVNLLTRGEELRKALKRELVVTDLNNNSNNNNSHKIMNHNNNNSSTMSFSQKRVSRIESRRELRRSIEEKSHSNSNGSNNGGNDGNDGGNKDDKKSSNDNDNNNNNNKLIVVNEDDNDDNNNNNDQDDDDDDDNDKPNPNTRRKKQQLIKMKSIRRLPGEDYNYEADLETKDKEALPSHIIEVRKRLLDLLSNPSVTSHSKAQKILEAIIELFSKVYVRTRHVVLIIKYFQYGETEKMHLFGSYLIELVIFFIPRIIDLNNFEIILNELSAEDCGALYCRIGWLNIFNPCKVDGGYELQLARRDERVVVKILVTLSIDEPCQNVSNQEFQWERSDPPIPGWDLTEGWKTAEGIPVRGILRLNFTSYGATATTAAVSTGSGTAADISSIASAAAALMDASSFSSSNSTPSVKVTSFATDDNKEKNSNNSNTSSSSSLSASNRSTFISSKTGPRVSMAITSNNNNGNNDTNTPSSGKVVSSLSRSNSSRNVPIGLTDLSSFTSLKRQYRVNNELRRILTFTCLIDADACLKCETEKSTRMSIMSTKKGIDIFESARSRRTLWTFLYPQ